MNLEQNQSHEPTTKPERWKDKFKVGENFIVKDERFELVAVNRRGLTMRRVREEKATT